MPTTSNFGWTTPADTDLVKDGALAIRTLGNGIDTSMAELKGGTTGQVLSKTSNTDMDFTWVTTDDANAIQNAIVDAKGDLIAASANDTPARLAVGNNGETLLADSSQTTGLRWGANYGFTAGKNKIINGDFNINQRAFTSVTTNGSFGFDRWALDVAGDGTATYSPQTFTAGTAPVTGYEATNFARIATASQTTTAVRTDLKQSIEDVRTFANQTITVSFWAKAASGTPQVSVEIAQVFGSGGSTAVTTDFGRVTLSTSWARYSVTGTVPSISGKTLGAGSTTQVLLWVSAGSNFNARVGSMGIQNNTFDFWGVQAEAGSVATAFQTATGTLAGELAACQRYYQRITATSAYYRFAVGQNISATQSGFVVPFKTTMRTTPTFSSSGNFDTVEGTTSRGTNAPTLSSDGNNTESAFLFTTIASGTTAYAVQLRANNSTTAYVDFSSEL